VQLFGGLSEMARVGHGGEIPEMAQFHVGAPFSNGTVRGGTFDGRTAIHIEQGLI
jgi:hypothetical protein